MPLRPTVRRLWFGLLTVFGLAPRGFFIPYRYAAGVAGPEQRAPYREAERRLEACAEVFGSTLDRIGKLAPEPERIAAPAGEGTPRPLPRWGQAWFPPLDAAVAYTIVRSRKPGRIVEVGSGHSTRFLARAVHDAGLDTRITAIDPAPRASLAGLGAGGRPVEWRRATAQEVGPGLAAELAAGDILFIDSSHILMPGTDVDLLFNHVLPALPEGALVHIHDVFLPDDYPEAWAWRGYNEQLAIIPMLTGGGWTPLFASRYVETRMAAELARTAVAALPNPERAPATSLWLEKA